jgi:hypothetical protein
MPDKSHKPACEAESMTDEEKAEWRDSEAFQEWLNGSCRCMHKHEDERASLLHEMFGYCPDVN